MNVEYDDDTRALADHARRLLDGRDALGLARKTLEKRSTHDAALWGDLGAQGWCGIAIDPADGGLGMGTIALCALAEEFGRSLAPTPFASSIYGFAQALNLVGSTAQRASILPDIAAGAWIGTLAFTEHPGAPLSGALGARFKDGRLTGNKLPVFDGAIADIAIVLADSRDGPGLFLADMHAPGVTRTTISTLDPTRNAAKVAFVDVAVEPLGAAGAGLSLAAEILQRQAVPLAFEQIGGADRCLGDAVSFAKSRYAFGRPIGGYQAIKHKLADMYVKNEMARSSAYFAAWAADHDPVAFPAAAAAARISASEAHWFAAREAIQVHGGIGFTWEMPCHLHYRRARHLAVVAGAPAWWRQRMATILRAQEA